MSDILIYLTLFLVGFMGGLAYSRHESYNQYCEGMKQGYLKARRIIKTYEFSHNDYIDSLMDKLDAWEEEQKDKFKKDKL